MLSVICVRASAERASKPWSVGVAASIFRRTQPLLPFVFYGSGHGAICRINQLLLVFFAVVCPPCVHRKLSSRSIDSTHHTPHRNSSQSQRLGLAPASGPRLIEPAVGKIKRTAQVGAQRVYAPIENYVVFCILPYCSDGALILSRHHDEAAQLCSLLFSRARRARTRQHGNTQQCDTRTCTWCTLTTLK